MLSSAGTPFGSLHRKKLMTGVYGYMDGCISPGLGTSMYFNAHQLFDYSRAITIGLPSVTVVKHILFVELHTQIANNHRHGCTHAIDPHLKIKSSLILPSSLLSCHIPLLRQPILHSQSSSCIAHFANPTQPPLIINPSIPSISDRS